MEPTNAEQRDFFARGTKRPIRMSFTVSAANRPLGKPPINAPVPAAATPRKRRLFMTSSCSTRKLRLSRGFRAGDSSRGGRSSRLVPNQEPHSRDPQQAGKEHGQGHHEEADSEARFVGDGSDERRGMASPRAWMMKMFSAKAVDRTRGLVMLAIAVFDRADVEEQEEDGEEAQDPCCRERCDEHSHSAREAQSACPQRIR